VGCNTISQNADDEKSQPIFLLPFIDAENAMLLLM
jgi:hypothetical protein